MTTVHIICQRRAFWRLLAVLVMAAAFYITGVSPALAQDFNPLDYFELSYNPVTFSKSDVQGSEEFYVTVSGNATCSKDLPIAPSEARIISQVVAEHAASGAVVTLNPEYTITIKPFPRKVGDTFGISQSVPLKFPADAPSGDYRVVGRIIEARVRVVFWIPVTEFLPQEQAMGTVKYTSPAPVSVTVTEPEAPQKALNPPTPLAETPVTTPPAVVVERVVPWWVVLIVFIALATTVFNIAWFLRRRRG